MAITISPTISDLVLTGAVPKVVKITVKNSDSVSRLLSLKISDVERSEVGTSLKLSEGGTGDTSLVELAQIIGPAERIIDPNETLEIAIQLNPPTTSLTKGRYGALVVTAEDRQGDESLAMQTSLSSLLFVRSDSAPEAKITLRQETSNGGFFRLPQTISVALRNESEVHTEPRGRILLLNPKREVLARGTLNETSNIVMPESERIFATQLSYLPNTQQGLVGKYQLIIEYRSNGSLEPLLITREMYYVEPHFAFWFSISLLTSVLVLYWLQKRLKLKMR